MAILAAALGASIAADIRGDIRNATKGLKDISLNGKVVYGNKKELEKIGSDFPRATMRRTPRSDTRRRTRCGLTARSVSSASRSS